MKKITNIHTWVPRFQYRQRDSLAPLDLADDKRALRISENSGIEHRYFMNDLTTSPSPENTPFPSLWQVCTNTDGTDRIIEVSNLVGPVYKVAGIQHIFFQKHWCPGSIQALEFAAKSQGRSVIVTVDTNSLLRGLLPDPSDINGLLGRILFGDAIVAITVGDVQRDGLTIVDFAHYDVERNDLVNFNDGKLYLHRDLPKVMPPLVEACIMPLLDRHGIAIEDVKDWVAHGGGRAILDKLEAYFNIDLWASRRVLSKYGNIGASSVFFALKEIKKRIQTSGEYVMVVSFGPKHKGGFTVGACLLEKN